MLNHSKMHRLRQSELPMGNDDGGEQSVFEGEPIDQVASISWTGFGRTQIEHNFLISEIYRVFHPDMSISTSAE
jgi:hypothetical protein